MREGGANQAWEGWDHWIISAISYPPPWAWQSYVGMLGLLPATSQAEI